MVQSNLHGTMSCLKAEVLPPFSAASMQMFNETRHAPSASQPLMNPNDLAPPPQAPLRAGEQQAGSIGLAQGPVCFHI